MITVDLRFMRGVASWQPVTKKAKGVPALEKISFEVADGKLTACVTDRYRIVYSVSNNAGDNETMVIPMAVIVQYVASVKHIKDDGVAVTVEVTDGTVVISGGGSTVSGSNPISGNYPNIMKLVAGFQADEKTDNNVWFNMAMLADVVKFNDPLLSATDNKNGEAWRFRQRVALDTSSVVPYLLDRGSPETFGVLFQPNRKN